MKKLSLLLLVVTMLALAACGATATPEPTKPPAVQATATPLPPPPPTATPVPPTATPKPVPQVLRLNAGSEPDTIDPQKASFVGEIDVIMKVFSNLLTFDSAGKLIPEMAADMPTLSADGLTYTFKLRPGLKYSDGRALTAKDFEYGWKRHMDPDVAGDYAFTGYVLVGGEAYNTADTKKTSKEDLQKLRDAVGVKAVDDLTVQFKLTDRAPYFLSIVAGWNGIPTREDMVTKGGEKWTEPATYIGNGPYILKSWEHQTKMVFVANANYFRGTPPIAQIEEVQINDAAVAFTAYLNGELDITGVGSNELAQVQGDAKLKDQYQLQPGTCTFYIGFNTTRKPFDNAKVRRAFAMAFDKEGFVKNVLKGLGIPANQFLPPGFPGYYSDLKGLAFSKDAAAKELADAGFAGGKGLPEIKYGYSASPRNQQRAEWFQQQLKDNLGVEIKLDPLESKAYTAAVKKLETTPQMYLLGWCQDYPDPQDWFTTVFDSKSTVSHTGWKNDDFDKAVRAADPEPDAKKRDDLYKQSGQILINDAPVAFFWYNVSSFVQKPYIQGCKNTPLDYYFCSTTIMQAKITAH
ncbi:MAG: peptide ABC transporter substrate-binding protein [Chloroflexi bacterium]|nr:peptide ABC transporter substrate-binding protein [Chloroflexota bacterium]